MKCWTTTVTLLVLLGAPAVAQRADAPLGEILKVLEQAPAPKPSPPPRPEVKRNPGSSIGTIDLPASDIEDRDGPAAAEIPADAPSPEPTEAEARWQAMLDERRAEINAVESPLVDRLNQGVADRLVARRREAERAQDEHRRALAEHEAAIRRTQEEHEAELERHRQEVLRQRAAYEARVRACLDGDRDACARDGE